MVKKILGQIQHYDWGGFQYIPNLLHVENNQHLPFAEYWLGAHQKAPSKLSATEDTLNKCIEQNPDLYLGKDTAEKFGRLPYLFKVLDVHDMLSIQVHPTKREAEKGFAKENAAGIPQDAPYRNYKDDNHKPEMMVALSDFYLLHGFKEKEKLAQQLSDTPELRTLLTIFQKESYKGLYKKIMTLPQEEVDQILEPLLARILPLFKNKKLSKKQPDYWAAKALDSGMTGMKNIDRGIFSIYFFNLLNVQPGEGIFQAAGIPHAYLEGQNIELMANSDNVLRGGLTKKHVDVDELLKHTVFEGVKPNVIQADNTQTQIQYPCTVPDFYLEQIRLEKGEKIHFETFSLEIILLLEGTISCNEITVEKGEAMMTTANEKVEIKAEADSVIFKAGVPKSGMRD